MACKLCGLEKPLQLSHIIPEFFYKPIYDEKHRIFPRMGGRLPKAPPLQKGIRERLLCRECEQKLSPYEKYNRRVLFGGTEIAVQQQGNTLLLSGLLYEKIRIFYLSILWRMSLAKGHRMWRNVQLGPHEEKIRGMIFRENPGEPHEYGFYCIVPLFDGTMVADWILEPDLVRNKNGRFYRVVMGGFLFLFHVSKVRLDRHLESRFVDKAGRWTITVVDARKIPFIQGEALRVYKALKRERPNIALQTDR